MSIKSSAILIAIVLSQKFIL